MDKRKLRSTIFQHLDGIVTAPVAAALLERGVLAKIAESRNTTLTELSALFTVNEGYLNVAIRVLASQGFLNYSVDNATDTIHISANENTQHLLSFGHLYQRVLPVLAQASDFDFQNMKPEAFSKLVAVFKEFKNNFDLQISSDQTEVKIAEQILKHIEGCLAGPIIVQLGMSGMFHKYFMETSFQAAEFHKEPENFEKILDFLKDLGWFTKTNSNFKFTETGLYFARRAASYGVTVSYLPMLSGVDELVFGKADGLRPESENEDEIHVNRKMNVW